MNVSLKGHTLFSFDFPPLDGGIARLCSELAAGLSRRGLPVNVLSQQPGDERDANCTAIRVTRHRPFRELSAFRQLLKRRGQGPVICGLWYPEGLLATLAGAGPRIVLAHGSELMPTRSAWRRGLWRRLMRWTLSNAALVAANSRYTKELVEKAAPDCRAVAIPLAVDHQRFTPGGRYAAKAKLGVSGKHVLLTVSRLKRYKGHETVFRALASLDERIRRDFVYLIAGKGPDRKALDIAARQLGIADLVRWLGYVPDNDLPDLYRAADLFVLCTREDPEQQEVEGFGLAFLEAQACGTPVVGTRTGGIPDAVVEGEGGWLIREDDDAALARLLARIASAPDEFATQGCAARARVERECTWEHYIEQFIRELASAGASLD